MGDLPAITHRSEPVIVHHEDGPGKYASFTAWHGNCLDAHKIMEPSSVALIPSSPPYPGVDQPQDDYVTFIDPHDIVESHNFLAEVWRMCYGLLADEGRLAVNIYDIPRGAAGMVPNVAITIDMCLRMGFVLREDYIWHKGASYKPPSGSWPYPKGLLSGNTYEHIIVFQKPLQYSARKIDPKSYPEDIREESRIDRDPGPGQWLNDPVWKIKADREARKLGHPFPFPSEVPERLIKLYTMAGDVVFDPFGGAGTTGIAAQRLNRRGIITELSKDYLDLIDTRTAQGQLL